MKKIRKWQILPVLFIAVGVAAAVLIVWKRREKESGVQSVEITVASGSIQATIRTAGNVEPQNRLEVKPPISGRIEKILVQEGDKVKSGQIVGWISSTERAALLDAARARGKEELAYWREVYKPTPLIAPIDGDVIVRGIEPGQTVDPNTAVIVLSDRLIVKARVDETDIGKVKAGQAVEVTLDAYPDVKAHGTVDHISYESKLINNVTVYEVDVVLEEVPEVFRSGMSAEVTVTYRSRDNVSLLPLEAVGRDKDGPFVLVSDGRMAKEAKRRITLGDSDEKNVEVVVGVNEGDTIVVRKKAYSPVAPKDSHSNPFMPFGRKKKRK